MKRTTVYIDGFNLYYGLYKSKNRRSSLTAYKWLDIGRLCHPPRSRPTHSVLHTLETVSHLVIHKGKFISTTKKGIPVDAKKYGLDLIEVRLFEEKGSDVNIATYLLLDAFRGACDKAVLISNDSDLAEPVRLVCDDLGLEVMVVSPYPWVTNDLKVVSTRSGPLEPRLVMQCQFPPTLVDAHGNQILKPRNW